MSNSSWIRGGGGGGGACVRACLRVCACVRACVCVGLSVCGSCVICSDSHQIHHYCLSYFVVMEVTIFEKKTQSFWLFYILVYQIRQEFFTRGGGGFGDPPL